MGRCICNIKLRNRLKLNSMKKYEKYTNYYKYCNDCSPNLMNEVFYLYQNHYNWLIFKVFATDNSRNKYLLNSSVYWANQLWQTLPSEIHIKYYIKCLQKSILEWFRHIAKIEESSWNVKCWKLELCRRLVRPAT